MHHASSCYHSVQAYLNYLTGFIIITTGPGGGVFMCTSLVPRPFEGRRKGLVHTVCACTKFMENFLV